MFAPFGDVLGRWGLLFRGFAMLTRGYRVVRPPWGRIPARPTHRRTTGRIPHGLHIVVSRAALRTVGTSSCHGPHPARPVHRRVTGRTPHGRHIVVSRAALRGRHIVVSRAASRKGSHYSVAVGERSEPAEDGPPIIIGPKGVEHTVHAGRSAGTSSCHGSLTPAAPRGLNNRMHSRGCSAPLGRRLRHAGGQHRPHGPRRAAE